METGCWKLPKGSLLAAAVAAVLGVGWNEAKSPKPGEARHHKEARLDHIG